MTYLNKRLAVFKKVPRMEVGYVFVVALFLSSLYTATKIPPFQSPDEFDHIKRAYLLSKGTLILDSPEGMSSGGMIDSGLASYFAAYDKYPFAPDRKVSQEEIDLASGIQWMGVKQFSTAPGTGYYFPIIYAPQATGLAVGEFLGMSVDASYRLARLLTLLAVCFLLLLAFKLYSPPIIIMALLIIPMSLFQISSASLDGISTAFTILALSVFLRIAIDKERSNPWLLLLLSISVFIIASARVHLALMVLLVYGSFFYTKDKKNLLAGLAVTVPLLIWMLVAIKTTHDTRITTGLSTTSIVSYYFSHPLTFLQVFLDTLTNGSNQLFYAHSFVGILGWLDTTFPNHVYTYFYTLLFLACVCSFSLKPFHWSVRTLLLVCAAGSVLVIFLALLVTWTPHPATIIHGVQGRYFLIPAIIFAYTISFREGPIAKFVFYRVFGIIILTFLFFFSTHRTTQLLQKRYYPSTKEMHESQAVPRGSELVALKDRAQQ